MLKNNKKNIFSNFLKKLIMLVNSFEILKF